MPWSQLIYFNRLYSTVVGVGAWAIMIFETFVASLRRRPSWSLVLDQLYQIGVLSLPVVAITGFSTGLVLAAQAFYQLGDKGLSSATGLLVAKSMLTEIGPSLTAFMVTGRVGSAMCAVLGTMKVTEQIDALKSMAVSPLSYLVAPRCLSGVIMLPILTLFSAIMGIIGGCLISVFYFGMTRQAYFEPMAYEITSLDIYEGCVKALVFGALISTISCYKGLTTTGGAAGVGRSITSSVVICYSLILIINFLLTVGLNTLRVLYTQA